MRAEEDVLSRTVIRALAGTVVNLQIHTVGGVIRPGDALLEIVPADERLIVEADVKPEDIDGAGLKAQVVLTAFDRRNVPPFEGTVIAVSGPAGRSTDRRCILSRTCRFTRRSSAGTHWP